MEKEALALMSGDTVIFFYDLFVLCLFLFELFCMLIEKSSFWSLKRIEKQANPFPVLKESCGNWLFITIAMGF